MKTYLSGNLAAPFWNGAGVLKEWATDAWTPENHNSRLPILHTATGAPEMHDYKNTQWLYDASYLRCKQLQLSYTLPKRWISKLGMSQCQIFVNGALHMARLLPGKPAGVYDLQKILFGE